MGNRILSYEEFRGKIFADVKRCPKNWRKGQSVFNCIDDEYGIAREVQFIDNIDCFYNDKEIERFIIASYKRYYEHLNDDGEDKA